MKRKAPRNKRARGKKAQNLGRPIAGKAFHGDGRGVWGKKPKVGSSRRRKDPRIIEHLISSNKEKEKAGPQGGKKKKNDPRPLLGPEGIRKGKWKFDGKRGGNLSRKTEKRGKATSWGGCPVQGPEHGRERKKRPGLGP